MRKPAPKGPKFAPKHPKAASAKPAGSRSAAPRSSTSRPAASGSATPRPAAGKPSTARPAGPKPAGARSTAPRSAAPRPTAARSATPRPAAARGAAKPRPATARPKAATPPRGPRTAETPGQERLQKLLAAAGIASRRACEAIILDGRVQVNGKTVSELGAKADPRRDEITVDLMPIHREAPVYILMNKPKGYVTTVKDDQGRPTVMALLKDVPSRLYPVGRLDFNSEGLLLMTNDGALAQILMGPEHEIPKVYLVKVHRTPKPELLKEFQEGFRLSGRRLKPCHIEVAEKGDNPWLKVTLTEGKNQQIRRMFAAVGHPVSKLRRVQFGPLADPLLKPGAWRFLSPQEITALKSL